MDRVLITGGAGFVGSNLAVSLASRHPEWEVVALDNLYRRGSELNLPRLREAGVEFVEGDVREPGDLDQLPAIAALIECSAEPSVMSGVDGDTGYLVHTNLTGAYNCLERARRDGAFVVFLSTSRVYPVAPQVGLRLEEAETRFELAAEQEVPGVSPAGISERFPIDGARTLYGATKLAAELLIEEYRAGLGVPAVIDRCGVIAGPWQMGKVDQGVFTHWMLAHHFRNPLTYIGFGGHGKQVRDLLHVEDLVDLVERQLLEPRALGRPHRERRRRPRVQPLAARDDRDLPPADRQRGPDRAGGGDQAGRRSDIPFRLREALRRRRVEAAPQRRAGAGRHPRLDRLGPGAHRATPWISTTPAGGKE